MNKVIIVGMGALGLLYGTQIYDGFQMGEGCELRSENHSAAQLSDDDSAKAGCELCFLMDEGRRERHAGDVVMINGSRYDFRVMTPTEYEGTADLVIFATKYHGLRDAALLARPLIDAHTTIISVLNGISSEEILGEYFDYGQIIDCVAIGMDAMREGSEMTFQNAGRLQVGARSPEQEGRLAELIAFFEAAHMPHEPRADIKRAMWNKFMINVGINQTCMVYETTYKGAVDPGPARDDMLAAMHEVIAVAEAEGISLTEDDLAGDLAILHSLNPDGYPSMRQDAIAGRRSEVDLFAGTVVRLAARHGISVPVNQKFLDTIRQMEAHLA